MVGCRNRTLNGREIYHVTHKRILWLDLETGGCRNPETESVLQLAAVLTNVEMDRVYAHQSLFIKPPDHLVTHAEALAVNKIDPELTADAIPEWAAVEIFKAFVQPWLHIDRMPIRLAGYNTPFDKAYCEAMLTRYDISSSGWWDEPDLDVLNWARQWLTLPRYRLVDVCDHYGIRRAKDHDALHDIYATIKVARALSAERQEVAR